jgi:hypothetical protein
MECEVFEPVSMASYPKFENLNCRLKKISVKAMIYWDIQN